MASPRTGIWLPAPADIAQYGPGGSLFVWKFDDWGDFWEDCEREERKSGSDDKTMMARPHVKIAQTSVTRATEPREGKEG